MSTDDLTPEDRQALLRWRLALGSEAERTSSRFALTGLTEEAGGVGLEPGRLGDLDQALSFVYEAKEGGLGASRPYIPKWLAAVRELFSHEVVALVQKDAIEKKGLTQLLFEPETLPLLEKNVELVATLMSARGLIPDRAREAARQIVREVVEEIRKTLENEIRTTVVGALRRNTTSPLRVMRNLDWKRTIQKNLKGWDTARKRLVPERLYFWANQQRRHEWDVAVVVDQSASMGESVVYSSIMAAIFASLEVLKTRLLFFDTEVVDVTHLLVDPVEVIFTARLGGGTDINRAVAYAQQNFVERPDKTLFILITDLYEGGNATELLGRLQQLVDSRVKVLCLLALTDSGTPSYDHEMARKLTTLGIPCFGCTPKLLVRVMERVMKGQDLSTLVAQEAK
ncbi:VWA domain-containing protein [Chondromyces crocatus]|uniref:von Willebrand factor A n=1 Tax=Chondromyces crocatus TaxID=52 RepID=A0A0K1E5D3_CHOCO|nr:VWA domain-containing protein [Chondromyces crocatus]AKT36081.1 von Willebrand factor A [Chondromyces crocatus]